jgi:hypothetical protein
VVQSEFVFELSGLNRNGNRVTLRSSSVQRLKISEWLELTFSIKDASSKKRAAFLTFLIRPKDIKGPRPYLSGSAEDTALATRFFRTFRQSPFRLLLFSSLSLLEKKGFHSFLAGEGVNDGGVAHKRQLRQRIISHERENGAYNEYFHRIGEFPRLSVPGLVRVLAANRPVPTRFLPPESARRRVRFSSYADLRLKLLGKAKYRAFRKARLAKK